MTCLINVILISRFPCNLSYIVELKFQYMAVELAISTNESSSPVKIKSEGSKLQGIKFFLSYSMYLLSYLFSVP